MSGQTDYIGELFKEKNEKKDDRKPPYVVVSPDGLEAYIKIPDNPLPADVTELLSKKDVVSGVDMELAATITKNLYDRLKLESSYLVAKGKKPVHGQPGELILRTKKPEDIILSSEDLTQVDYKVYKRKLLAIAEQEKPVAMIIDPTNGHDGLDVHGNTLKGENGADVEIVMGKNVYQSGRKLISKIDGLIEYKKDPDGKIHFDITEVYMVDGDVDYTTGNVDFPGSVIVRGIIKAGFEVRAKNEVVADTIRGNVFAGGSVVAKQGIIGGVQKAYIECGGSVHAKFIQGAKIIADDSVEVKKSIIMAEIYAEGFVLVDNAPGSIIGGSINAVNGVDARVLGSESFVRTEILLCRSAKSIIKIKQVIAKRFEVSKHLLRIETYLGKEKDKLFSEASGDRQDLANKLLAKREELRRELLEKNAELKELQEDLRTPVEGQINVGRTVWPEVRVSVAGKFLLLKNETGKVTYFYNAETDSLDFR